MTRIRRGERRAVATTGRRALSAAALALLAGCVSSAPPLDLLDTRPTEASVAGHDHAAVVAQIGRPYRLNDVLRRTLPAGPPSRLRFKVDVPEHARLDLAYAIAEKAQDRPAVEFVVKVLRKGGEQTVWTSLLDPLSRPEHRGWVPATIDLSAFAGRGVDLVLETRGYEAGGDMKRAFWGAPALTVADARAPLIVIYLVDTLRADHTGPYGYARDTTPELNAFAKDAVVFDKAIAHASWTKPSVASILTSLLPGQHRAVQLRDALDAGHVTIAEMLKAKRYSTGAAIANSVIYLKDAGFDRGFDFFAGLHGEEDRPSKLVEASVVVDSALAWLDARRGLPSFLYVHTMDPHVPYQPPPPFDRKFAPHPTPDHPGADPRSDYKEPEDLERLIAQYDGDVAYGDREFGRFVRGLKERGVYDRALIVFMGDHGEEFLDHGKWLHGRSVFDELVRIPLVVKFPGQNHAGRRVAAQVQGVDVLPTILASEGLPVPAPPAIAGRPLQLAIQGAEERPAVSEISHRGFVAHGIRTNEDKYVQRFSPEQDELYFDLAKDPKELTSILGQKPERVRQLRARVEAAMTPNPFRYVLRAAGTSEYVLSLRTGGWIEGVEATGFGQGERYDLVQNGRELDVRVHPRPGQTREIAFTLRPRGAPVWMDGTRDARPLKTTDVAIAQGGSAPLAVPVKLPEIESEGEERPKGNLFAPPASPAAAALQLWLAQSTGHRSFEMDKETCERMRALGYVGTCAAP
jgi:arylsulfatase A-like enzyme